MPGRWADARQPNRKELAATLVLALPLTEWSVKVSDGPPDDAAEDLDAAGVGRRAAAARGVRRAERRARPAGRPRGARLRPRLVATVTEPLPAYRSLSLWHDTADDDFAPRPSLPGDLDVDVAIVGAGYTGLWTAYYLRGRRPVAADRGAGARGRRLRRERPQRRLVLGAVPRVGRLAGEAVRRRPRGRAAPRDAGRRRRGRAGSPTAEGIDCHFTKGGTVVAARTPVQLDAGPRRGGRGAPVGLRRRRPGAARCRRGDVAPAGGRGARRRPTRRTARRSTRRGWPAGWLARWSGTG